MTTAHGHQSSTALTYVEPLHIHPLPDHQPAEWAPKMLLEFIEKSGLLLVLIVRIDRGLLDQLPQPGAPSTLSRHANSFERASVGGTRRTSEGVNRQ
jgi:hypothetical protein